MEKNPSKIREHPAQKLQQGSLWPWFLTCIYSKYYSYNDEQSNGIMKND